MHGPPFLKIRVYQSTICTTKYTIIHYKQRCRKLCHNKREAEGAAGSKQTIMLACNSLALYAINISLQFNYSDLSKAMLKLK